MGLINPSIKLDHSQMPLLAVLLELETAKGSTVTLADPLVPSLLKLNSTSNTVLGTPEL